MKSLYFNLATSLDPTIFVHSQLFRLYTLYTCDQTSKAVQPCFP